MSINEQESDIEIEESHTEMTDSGIETMNKSDEISLQTRLYGLIAEYASQDRLFVFLNRLIKKNDTNAMMIPMNIREDDFYFTLSNMKKSHVNGAFIASEYQKDAVELLDSHEDIVTIAGRCDFVRRDGETLHGDFVAPEAIKKFLNSKTDVKSIAIVGSGAMARALAITLQEYDLSFYCKYVEALLALAEVVEMDIDINRISNDLSIDLGKHDVVINVSHASSCEGIIALPKYCMDLEFENELSELQIACTQFKNSSYIGYETLLATMSETLYNKYIK